MDDLLGYRGKRAVVTGCYSGIGRAVASLLLDLGAEVHGLDLQANELPLHAFTPLDLRDPASIDAAAQAVGGRVDMLFNCAGVAPGRPAMEVLKVNFIGTRQLTELLLPAIPAGGAIANVASNGGADWARRLPMLMELAATESFAAALAWCQRQPEALNVAYSFSKEAIFVWTMAGAAGTIRKGVRMNAISPGAVQTPMIEEVERNTPRDRIDIVAQPIGRRSNPEEQAWPMLMLNSDKAGYVNGAVLPVDGGFVSARITGQIAAPAEAGRK